MSDKILNIIREIQKWIGAIFIFALCVLIFVGVITRFVFFHSLPWSEELGRYLFIWMLFFCMSIGVHTDAQIRIDVLDSFLHGRVLACKRLIEHIFSLAAVAIMFYSTIQLVKLGLHSTSAAMHIPMWLVYLCMPLGNLMIMVELVLQIVQCGKKAAGKEQER